MQKPLGGNRLREQIPASEPPLRTPPPAPGTLDGWEEGASTQGNPQSLGDCQVGHTASQTTGQPQLQVPPAALPAPGPSLPFTGGPTVCSENKVLDQALMPLSEWPHTSSPVTDRPQRPLWRATGAGSQRQVRAFWRKGKGKGHIATGSGARKEPASWVQQERGGGG